MRSITVCGLLIVCTLTISACAAKRPVLYPNDHLKATGQAKANQEVDECLRLAAEYQAGSGRTGEIARDAGKAGVVGAATGAVIGAFTGSLGRSSAIGGAGAATAAMGSGLMRSDEPDPVLKQFVDQCLREKGYQPLGWR